MLDTRQPVAVRTWSCPLGACDGSGFVIDEATNTARDCGCRASQIANARARRMRDRVPQRYLDLSWDRNPLPQIAAENPDSVRRVRRYCDHLTERLAKGEGLWLQGHTGTGKTTLGYMVAAAAVRAQHAVLSFNAVALLNRVRATFDPDARETAAEVIDTLASVDLLHVEDLRVVRPTEWVLEQLYLIVNSRYEAKRSIVFTSDIDSDEEGPLAPHAPRELGDHIGQRTFSRLFEMCGDPVYVQGRDHRTDKDVTGYRG